MKKHKIILFLLIITIFGLLSKDKVLSFAGEMLIQDTTPDKADAAIVLSTGVDYYPRLLHAANLYNKKNVDKIIIDGNRKTDVLRAIEANRYQQCCPWYENAMRILV